MNIKIKRIRPIAILPKYQTEQSAGMDLYAALDQPVVIKQLERAMIPTGIAVALPEGYELQIRARSGLAAKFGIGLVNGVGTIDADYRGEINVILINYAKEAFIVNPGERIAQAVVSKYETVDWTEVKELDETARGGGGFGSTGSK